MYIDYIDIKRCSEKKINIWDEWRLDLSVIDIINWLEITYNLVIKDIYQKHFLTEKKIFNIVFNIEECIDLITYKGSEGELLVMFSIVSDAINNHINLLKISNLIEKKVILRDIKLNNLLN